MRMVLFRPWGVRVSWDSTEAQGTVRKGPGTGDSQEVYTDTGDSQEESRHRGQSGSVQAQGTVRKGTGTGDSQEGSRHKE